MWVNFDLDVLNSTIIIAQNVYSSTTHWVVSDCDLGKVSVYTSSRDCVGLHMHVVGCVCVLNFETKFF